ncbi:uncharacterized protein METZ01_LOCUS55939 [marine metagenome]|uniref:Uncharacterized protein n=1 Tax=marine metagenome TaxID=408172 RepID=A0A381SG85_9ZZZZ
MPMQAPIVEKEKNSPMILKIPHWRVNIQEGCMDKIRTNWCSHPQLTDIHWGNGGVDGT